jgi:hypothetical protein
MVVNGRHYPMWSQFVEKKSEWIGGKLHETDNIAGTCETTITDIKLEPNGDDSAMFIIKGKDFDATCDVRFLGIAGKGNGLILHTQFGTSWRISKP